ncbi:unnamed protein product, partial [Allacma fusca]
AAKVDYLPVQHRSRSAGSNQRQGFSQQRLPARIVALHPGADSLVQAVTAKTKSGGMKRPVTKLWALIISMED